MTVTTMHVDTSSLLYIQLTTITRSAKCNQTTNQPKDRWEIRIENTASASEEWKVRKVTIWSYRALADVAQHILWTCCTHISLFGRFIWENKSYYERFVHILSWSHSAVVAEIEYWKARLRRRVVISWSEHMLIHQTDTIVTCNWGG